MTCLVYRWALAPVETGRWPVLQVRWTQEDSMTCCVVPHDPLMQPEKDVRQTR